VLVELEANFLGAFFWVFLVEGLAAFFFAGIYLF
jgi:hypothetical protein